ncbi:hypothetical protein C8R44DRAFT_745926 [Mycena epipterygia]|nr:hypothetical protein C8R44DRAFT_745926 [Mycena epipterygia]
MRDSKHGGRASVIGREVIAEWTVKSCNDCVAFEEFPRVETWRLAALTDRMGTKGKVGHHRWRSMRWGNFGRDEGRKFQRAPSSGSSYGGTRAVRLSDDPTIVLGTGISDSKSETPMVTQQGEWAQTGTKAAMKRGGVEGSDRLRLGSDPADGDGHSHFTRRSIVALHSLGLAVERRRGGALEE